MSSISYRNFCTKYFHLHELQTNGNKFDDCLSSSAAAASTVVVYIVCTALNDWQSRYIGYCMYTAVYVMYTIAATACSVDLINQSINQGRTTNVFRQILRGLTYTSHFSNSLYPCACVCVRAWADDVMCRSVLSPCTAIALYCNNWGCVQHSVLSICCVSITQWKIFYNSATEQWTVNVHYCCKVWKLTAQYYYSK